MSDREKLIELLGAMDNCITEQCKDCAYANSAEECITARKKLIADHLIANGVTVQKWIPVSERLPDDVTERVLVAISGNQPIGSPRIDTDRYNGSWWIRYGGTVTHWMPLPMPPKDGE